MHTVTEARGKVNSAVANDWNGDGEIDVIASHDGKVFLYQGPDWKPHVIHEFKPGLSRNKPRTSCIHSCLMDVDGDGDQDFVGSNNTVFWLECPDDALSSTWKYRTVDDEILGTHCLITGDVNQDGKLDLIANSGRTAKQTTIPDSLTWQEIPKNPHSAKSWTRHVFANRDAPGGSHDTGFGDVNGDGRSDISCAAKGGEKFPGGQWFAWWEQPKDSTQPWNKHLLAENQPGATNILPADLNRNGYMDFFATRGHGKGVLWFKGPKFELIEIDPDNPFPHSLDLADMDADGDLDAITCSKDPGGFTAWYENDGKANFTRHVVARNQGSYDTRTVDMDADGDLDILLAGHTSNNVVWLENPMCAKNSERIVVLTFDDSVKSHYTYVGPALKEHGFGATFFITEGFKFTTDKEHYMTWEEIKQLHQDGFEIGNHTRNHKAVSSQSEEQLTADIEHIEKQCIKHGIPKPVTFCYPGYRTSDLAVKVLKQRGYKYARAGGARAYDPTKDNPLLLPQAFDGKPGSTLDQFKAAIAKAQPGKPVILTFHGVPDIKHPWVNTSKKKFQEYMKHLKESGCRVIALRDLE